MGTEGDLNDESYPDLRDHLVLRVMCDKLTGGTEGDLNDESYPDLRDHLVVRVMGDH